MNVQNVGCQPIKPTYGSIASRPVFKGDDSNIQKELEDLRELSKVYGFSDEKKEKGWTNVLKGALMASIAYFTLIAAAPKTIDILSSGAKKVANLGIVKKPALYIKDKSILLGQKVKNLYNKINPESKTGKVKQSIEKYATYLKSKTYDPAARYTLGFIEKHNINAPKLKNYLVKSLAAMTAGCAFIESTGLADPVQEEGGCYAE